MEARLPHSKGGTMMTTLSRTYTDNAATDATLDIRERTGGPRNSGGRGRSGAKHTDFYERFVSNSSSGSHMPLDLDMHWEWSNPLNIIPAFALLLVIIAAVALIVG
jgi:hypothetical protein